MSEVNIISCGYGNGYRNVLNLSDAALLGEVNLRRETGEIEDYQRKEKKNRKSNKEVR